MKILLSMILLSASISSASIPGSPFDQLKDMYEKSQEAFPENLLTDLKDGARRWSGCLSFSRDEFGPRVFIVGKITMTALVSPASPATPDYGPEFPGSPAKEAVYKNINSVGVFFCDKGSFVDCLNSMKSNQLHEDDLGMFIESYISPDKRDLVVDHRLSNGRSLGDQRLRKSGNYLVMKENILSGNTVGYGYCWP